MNRALIVIDAQNDFITGALANPNAVKALPTLKNVVEYARGTGFKIFYTMDTHNNDYLETQEGKNLPVPHCIRYTSGWGIDNSVAPHEEDIIIEKFTFGYDDWADWGWLKDMDEIWIAGFCTDICVVANFMILKACFPEVPIVVIADACAGVTQARHDAAIITMESCQARIIDWEDIAYET